MGKEWQNRILNVLKYGNPNFLIHPHDTRRMREAIYFAKLSGATKSKIKAEVKDFYSKAGGSKFFVDEQLARIDKLYKFNQFQKLKKKAWLILWRNSTDDFTEQDVITIIDSRKSVRYVTDFIFDYYISTKCSLEERVHFASHKRDFPFGVHVQKQKGHVGTKLRCGCDPYIEALLVRNLQLHFEDNNRSVLNWED